MNKTMAKIVGAVKKVNKEYNRYNVLFEAGEFDYDDSYCKWWERRLENLSDSVYEDIVVLNKQLGTSGIDNPSDWFRLLA